MVFESFVDSLSYILWSTFLISVIFGAVVNKTNFCTMGAVSDMVNIGDYGRFRAWMLAIATAILGVALLEYFSLVNVESTFPQYRNSTLIIGENVIGGFLFGVGGGMGNIKRLYKNVPASWGEYVFSDVVHTRLVAPEYGDSSGVRGAAWL